MKKLAFIGAGSHSDAIFPMINHNEFKFVGYIDDKPLQEYNTYPILGKIVDTKKLLDDGICDAVFIAIGDNDKRCEVFESIADDHYYKIVNIISNSATILDYSSLKGRGIFVGHGSFIGAKALINDNSIINTGSLIEHHTVVGKHCNIAPNSTLNGIVTLGNNCYVGSSATIIQSISICDDVFLGAGCVIVSDINKPGLYVGVPGKFKRENI